MNNNRIEYLHIFCIQKKVRTMERIREEGKILSVLID
jgi:hypothetical protein